MKQIVKYIWYFWKNLNPKYVESDPPDTYVHKNVLGLIGEIKKNLENLMQPHLIWGYMFDIYCTGTK